MNLANEGTHNNISDDNSQVEFQDNSSLHLYRTELPNIIFELNLDVYEFKAYCVMKRIAGDRGSCFKSNANLILEIGCKKTKLKEIKKSLEDIGLITITKRKNSDGGDSPDLIEIVDIWNLNMSEMSKKYKKKESTLKLKRGGRQTTGGGSPHDRGGSPNDPKEDPYNKISIEETTTTTSCSSEKAAVAVSFSNDILKDLPLTPAEQASFTLQFTNEQLEHMAAYYRGRIEVHPEFVPQSWASYLAKATKEGYAIPRKATPRSGEEENRHYASICKFDPLWRVTYAEYHLVFDPPAKEVCLKRQCILWDDPNFKNLLKPFLKRSENQPNLPYNESKQRGEYNGSHEN